VAPKVAIRGKVGDTATPPACGASISLLAKLHELVEPERVREAVDGVELAGHEDAFEQLIVGKTCHSKRIDVFIGDLEGVLGELEAETQERLVLLLDREGIDVRGFGGLRRFLAASYRPQEEGMCLRSVGA
jgi:hypothetical protein